MGVASQSGVAWSVPARIVGMEPTTYTGARWPKRLRDLAQGAIANDPEGRKDLWVVLQIVFAQYTRRHAQQLGALSREEVEDVASEKSLHLFGSLESGKWNPAERSDGEIMAYLSKAARNGVIDVLRQSGKIQDLVPEEADPATMALTARIASAGDLAQSSQFADAIRDCSAGLERRARVAWFLRVLLDMNSKRIGAHPRIDRSPGAVDVLLKRTRDVMKTCMENKGFSTHEIPRGTFTQLWNTLNPQLKEIER